MAEPPVAPLGKRNLDDDESWEDAAKRLRGQDSQAAPDAEAAALEFAAAGVLMQQPPELPPVPPSPPPPMRHGRPAQPAGDSTSALRARCNRS